MTEENDNETKTVTYYGKKLYYLNPKIARLKPVPEATPDYSNEEYTFQKRTNPGK